MRRTQVDPRRRRAREPFESAPIGHHGSLARAETLDQLAPADVLHLQRTAGNKAVTHLLSRRPSGGGHQGRLLQRNGILKIKPAAQKQSEAEGAAKAKPKAKPSTHPEAGALRDFLVDLEEKVGSLTKRHPDPVERLEALANIGEVITRLPAFKDGSLRAAVKALFDEIPVTVQRIFDRSDELRVPLSADELQQRDYYDATEAQRTYFSEKIQWHTKQHGKAWTKRGKKHHVKRAAHYGAQKGALPSDYTLVMGRSQLVSKRNETLRSAVNKLLAPMKTKLDAVYAIVGGKDGLELPASFNLMEAMLVAAQPYAGQLSDEE